jgi:hypothetical protein
MPTLSTVIPWRNNLVGQNRLHHICIAMSANRFTVLQNLVRHTHVVQLARAGIHSLQQLIHLLITHLLAQVRQNVPELSHANETREVLVEDLEPAAVLFWLARVAEAAWTVEDAGEVVEVDCVQVSSAMQCASLGVKLA